MEFLYRVLSHQRHEMAQTGTGWRRTVDAEAASQRMPVSGFIACRFKAKALMANLAWKPRMEAEW